MKTIKNNGVADAMRWFTLARGVAPVVALALVLVACDTDDLLDVDDPSVVTGEEAVDPEVVPILVTGAISEFHVSYSGGGGDAYLSNVANFTDEMRPADTFPTRKATDQREQFPIPQGNTSDGAFVGLHQARRALSSAAAAVAAVSGEADPRFAELKALEGFTYVALGEAFCSNIPFSEVGESGEYLYGDPLATAAVFDAAVERFDAALAGDASSNLAKVGKGRALLNNGQYAAAAAAVAGVPTDFVYVIDHSANSGRQNNPLYSLQSNGRYTVADNEGGNGLPFMSAGDPRVPWEDAGVGFDGATELYLDLRYPLRDSDVPVAGGVEARLIEAEAALQAGDAAWLDILNDLRANVADLMAARVDNYAEAVPDASLPLLTDPDPAAAAGPTPARVDLLFYERAFWLYTTGHRLGDLRRLIRQYGRNAEDVFPTGAYFEGGVYGDDVTLPVDFDENNNPKYDISMCNVGQA